MNISTREIERAREEYLQFYTAAPNQLNLKRYRDKDGEVDGWDVEFHEYEGCCSRGFTLWESDKEKILDIFFSCDPKKIDTTFWEDEFDITE